MKSNHTKLNVSVSTWSKICRMYHTNHIQVACYWLILVSTITLSFVTSCCTCGQSAEWEMFNNKRIDRKWQIAIRQSNKPTVNHTPWNTLFLQQSCGPSFLAPDPDDELQLGRNLTDLLLCTGLQSIQYLPNQVQNKWHSNNNEDRRTESFWRSPLHYLYQKSKFILLCCMYCMWILGMWHCVTGCMIPDILKGHDALIIREKKSMKDTWDRNMWQWF